MDEQNTKPSRASKEDPFNRKPGPRKRHLFTLKIWREPVAVDHWEWRGELVHIPSGETRYFRRFDLLSKHLDDLLQMTNECPS